MHLIFDVQVWCRVAYDESLWKALLWRRWSICGVELPPGRDSWYQEYRRLFYHCPVILSETLRDHSDEVLHVSFSNRGDMFSTTSKDASIKVMLLHFKCNRSFCLPGSIFDYNKSDKNKHSICVLDFEYLLQSFDYFVSICCRFGRWGIQQILNIPRTSVSCWAGTSPSSLASTKATPCF